MRRTILLSAILAMLSLARVCSSAVIDATWLLNGNGNWNTAGNWDIGVVPNNNATDQYNVRIDNDTNFNVVASLDTNSTINNLTVDSGDILSVSNEMALTIAGTITNNGTIAVNSSGTFAAVILSAPTTTLSGSGTILLGGHDTNRLYGSAGSTHELIIPASHTIAGGGQLGFNLLNITNQGTIEANSSGNSLVIDPSAGGLTNTGTLQASGGGVLNLKEGTFTNTGSVIRALDGSIVELARNAAIVGGTLSTSGSGVIKAVSATGTSLEDVTIDTGSLLRLVIVGGFAAKVDLRGTITNNGRVVQTNGGVAWLREDVTLTGTGVWELDYNITGVGVSTYVLTNETLHTIQGKGELGYNFTGLNNRGLVDANQATPLVIDPSATGVVNTGTLRASGGGTLRLQDGTFTNTGGFIRALDGSTVEVLNYAVIVGGTLATTGSGVIKVNSTFDAANPQVQDVSLDNANLLQVNRGLTLKGIFTNNGIIEQGVSGVSADILTDGNVTLTGPGVLTLSNNALNGIRSLVGTTDILTNGAAHTIQGAGTIGEGAMGLVNYGLIEANLSNALIIDPSAANVTNTGTLRASAGGTLRLAGGTFTNTGGFIRALDASTVELTNDAVIVGGTLAAAGSGAINVVASVSNRASLQDVTIDAPLLQINGGLILNGTMTNNNLLQINNGSVLTLNGTHTNNGSIALNSTGSATDLILASTTTFTNNGTISLSGHSNNRLYGSGDTSELINTSSHTITGGGQLGVNLLKLTNHGTIDANSPGNALVVDPSAGGFTNNATLRASGGGILRLQDGTFTNTGGFIHALDGSTIEFAHGAVVVGGILSSAGSGVFKAIGTNGIATLQDVTLDTGRLLQINNSADPILKGTITNNGTIEQNDANSFTAVRIDGNVTLTGPGVWRMSNFTNNQIYGLVNTNVLTNALGHTIQGAGQIGVNAMGLNNNGLIDNNQTAMLTIDPSTAGVINTSTMQSSGGGILRLIGGTFTNTGGSIRALNASTVELATATIVGGTLATSGTGVIRATSNTVTLQDVTLDTSSLMQIINDGDPVLKGTIANNGTIEQNSTGSFTDVKIDGNVTLAGPGVWRMSNNTNNRLYALAVVTHVLTNDAAHTIQGAGQLGLNGMGLINNGLIDNNQSAMLTIDPSTAGVINTSTMQSSGGGILRLIGGTFTNTGGSIRALNASTVELATATIVGGTLATSGTGVIRATSNTVTLQDVTLDTSSLMQIINDGDPVLKGTIANNGTIEQNSTGSFTEVRIDGDVTLTGPGLWTLSNNANNRIYGLTGSAYVLTNANGHTIQGAGSIGFNAMGLINDGLIHANQAVALTIDPSAANLVNQSTGILRGSGAAGLQLTGGTFNNQGTIESLNGSNVTYSTSAVTSNNVAGVLTGGTWCAISTGGAATITLRGSNITQIAAGTEVVLSGTGAVLQVATTRLNTTLTTNAGTLRILDGHQLNLTNPLNNTGTLAGNGTVVGNVQSSGIVAPGASPGTLAITGNYTQNAGGTLAIEIGGDDNSNPSDPQFDVLAITGAASLSGLLELALIDNFVPATSDVFTILDANSLSGTYNNVANGQRLDTVGGDGSFVVTYDGGAGNVILSDFLAAAGLPGDFNFDGKVNAADYVVWRKNVGSPQEYNNWQTNFGRTTNSQDETGDYNFDGASNAADYVAWRKLDGTPDGYDRWRTHFGESADGSASGGANPHLSAPEPSAALLFAFGALGYWCQFMRRATGSRCPPARHQVTVPLATTAHVAGR